MTKLDAWMAFSRWQSSDHTDYAAAAMLSRLVGWDVAAHYAEPDTDPWFWDDEIEQAVENRYGLLELENPPRDLGKWHLGMRVSVYWNLHTDRWSVRANDTGRVVAHGESVYLVAPRFMVREAGRQLVLREKKKNVHAFVVGELAGIDTPPPAGVSGWSSVTYNPYRDGSFIDRDTREPVRVADLAYFDIKDDGKPRVRADGAIDVPIRSNGATDLYGAYETVYERPADGYLLVGHRTEAYWHLSLRVRPVLTDPTYSGRKDQQDATGWEWTWVHPGTNDPFDRATDTIPEGEHPTPVPVSSQGIAPTRGDAIREAIRQIESAPDFDAAGMFYRRYLRPILAELELDERLAQTIKPELVDYVHDPDHAENYALHLDQVVAGLLGCGARPCRWNRVTTAVIKRVIAAMDRNSVEVHGALIEALGGIAGWRPGMTLVKGWSVGDDGQPTPPVGVPTSRHGARVSLPGDDEAWKLWTQLRGRYVINQSVGWSLAPHDPQGRPPQRWDPISAAFQNAVHDAKVGSLLFGYTSFKLMHRLPGMEVKLKDGWYSVTAANGHADLTQRHSAEQIISVLSSPAFYGSGDFIVYLLDPSSEITSVLLNKDTTEAKRDEAIFLRLQAVARWLPGVSFWGPTMLATRRAEAAAEAAAQAMKPGDIAGKPAPLTPVLLAQINELDKRARRRYVAAKLHMGGQLPVRRNYVQVVLAVIGMVLPIIIEQLGSSLADFNRAPRIERQRKLIAILSSRLWWLSANPVTVMAARQVAASEKLQNAVLDLLEKHGKEAVAVAGDAAQAALQGQVARRANPSGYAPGPTPVEKPGNRATLHPDGTVSFYSYALGSWERLPASKLTSLDIEDLRGADQPRIKAARQAAVAGGK